jgi:hypothetical protein
MATVIVFKDKSTLTLDAAMSQGHGRSAEVTRHEVEEGSDITDHIRSQPHTLTVNAIVSYRPVGAPGEEPAPERHKRAFERIERAIDAGETVTVQTGLKVYKNMAITSFDAPREVKTGYSLVCSLSLVEVRFATAKVAKVPLSAIGKPTPGASTAAAKVEKSKTQDQAALKQAKGQKAKSAVVNPKVAKVAEDTKPKSLLKTIFGG